MMDVLGLYALWSPSCPGQQGLGRNKGHTDRSKMEMNYKLQRYPPDVTQRYVILSDPVTEKHPNI